MSQLSYLKDEASDNDTGGSLVRRRENDSGTNKTPLEDMSESIHLGTVKEYNSNIKQLQASPLGVLGFWGFGVLG